MAFTRWLRAVSERQLLIAAQREVADRYGATPPLPPHGVDRLWQQVYVPVYHRLPWTLRSSVMRTLPGSHRRTWHPTEHGRDPAV